MAMKDFNFKQFMLEKGEKVGVGVAAGLAGLLLFMALLSVFSGKSPAQNAKDLTTLTQQTQAALDKVVPLEEARAQTPGDLPPEKKVDAKEYKGEPIVFDQFMVASLFSPSGKLDTRRQKPEIFLPEESKVEVTRMQLRSWILSMDPKTKETLIMLLPGESEDSRKQAGNAYSPNGPGRGSMRGGMRGGGTDPPGAPGGEGSGTEEKKPEYIPATKEALEAATGKHPAETIRPKRAAYIVASFPFRAQVEEFRRKLRLKTNADVRIEINEFDKEDKDATGRYSFRFAGVKLERRVLDSFGKPIVIEGKTDAEGWVLVDVENDIGEYMMLSGWREEPEDDAKLELVSFEGLVMPRLLQFREKQYPKLEGKLEKLKDAIEEVSKAGKDTTSASSLFKGGNPNRIWNKGSDSSSGSTGLTSSDKNIRKPSNPNMPSGTGTGTGTGGNKNPKIGPGSETGPGSAEDKTILPLHCLVRVMDVSIEPGKIYQYRMKIRMANPNYKRFDKVASNSYARDPVLESSDWYVLPQKVVVPPETIYYAADQKRLDGPTKYAGINSQSDPDRKQTVLQIHRWIESLPDKSGKDNIPVGEWVVAERLAVRRGEYVGRPQKISVPVWKYTLETFVLPGDNDKPRKGIEVPFNYGPHEDAVLVDFDSSATHERPAKQGEKSGTLIRDDSSTEVLILSHDGRLIMRDSAVDEPLAERKDTLEKWRKRIKDIRDKKDTTIRGGGTN